MRYFKYLVFISIFAFLLVALVKTSYASFLVIDENGNLVWQILGKEDDGNEDRNDDLKEDKSGSSQSRTTESVTRDDSEKENEDNFRVEVKTTNRGEGKETGGEVKIKNEDGKVKLRVETTTGETEMDVTNLEDDIVRVSQREDEQEIRIRARGDRLEIRQKGIGALTHFPVSVNPETNELTITTPSGVKVVAVLPSVAVANILQSNIMDRILSATPSPSPIASASVSPIGTPIATEEAELEDKGEEIEIVEEDGAPAFKIQGTKDVRFLNILPLEVPVTAFVSTQTGETLNVSRPWFLNLFGILFSK